MNNSIECITGEESIPSEKDPLAALVAFYRGFNHRDLQAMQYNWAAEYPIVMSNPIGGLRKGRKEILQGYEKIFTSPAKVYVEFYDYTLMQTENMYCVAGRERGFFKLKNETINLEIRTSRIYLLIQQGWKQIHHHGSIDNPDLLQRYQSAIFNI